jgi:CheY-like chemotaxis protein
VEILHLEDHPTDDDLVGEILAADFPDCSIALVQSRDAFIDGLAAEVAPHLIISDLPLPDFDGVAALEVVRGRAPGNGRGSFSGRYELGNARLCASAE